MTNKNRPISPHLQIYKPQITSVLSISHRFTGIILYLSTFLITFFLFSLVFNEEIYNFLITLFISKFGKLILFFITLSFIYHFLNGVRHLIWDIGFGFQIMNVYLTGFIIIFLSLALNFYFWFF